jgi:cytosine/adenosine deaminase-related metal-dependent hydrolase
VSGQSDRPTCLEIFTAATVGSADALQRPDLGRLAAGARADLVCFDLSGFHFGPILDPIRALISCGSGNDVDRVYVDGRLVVDGGRALHTDEAALRAAAPAILQRQLEAATARDPLGRTAATLLAESARAL